VLRALELKNGFGENGMYRSHETGFFLWRDLKDLDNQ